MALKRHCAITLSKIPCSCCDLWGCVMSEDERELDDSDLVEVDDSVSLMDDSNVDSSLTAKEAERQRIQAEIEAFLKQGGQITQVDNTVMTDPPRRPESNYGGQPI